MRQMIRYKCLDKGTLVRKGLSFPIQFLSSASLKSFFFSFLNKRYSQIRESVPKLENIGSKKKKTWKPGFQR